MRLWTRLHDLGGCLPSSVSHTPKLAEAAAQDGLEQQYVQRTAPHVQVVTELGRQRWLRDLLQIVP